MTIIPGLPLRNFRTQNGVTFGDAVKATELPRSLLWNLEQGRSRVTELSARRLIAGYAALGLDAKAAVSEAVAMNKPSPRTKAVTAA